MPWDEKPKGSCQESPARGFRSSRAWVEQQAKGARTLRYHCLRHDLTERERGRLLFGVRGEVTREGGVKVSVVLLKPDDTEIPSRVREAQWISRIEFPDLRDQVLYDLAEAEAALRGERETAVAPDQREAMPRGLSSLGSIVATFANKHAMGGN